MRTFSLFPFFAAATIASAQGIIPYPDPVPPWRPVPWIDVTPKEIKEDPCTVESLDVSARVKGLFATVDTEITLKNPNDRVISCPLQFPLPDGATVCGYALDVDGRMVDGVAVPNEQARVAFETEQRRGVDPGLVEAVKGNVYRTRVYPVPAKGSRRVRVSYTAPLVVSGTSAALALPMPDAALARRSVKIEVEDIESGAPTLGGLGDLRFEQAARVWTVSSAETNVTPKADVLVAMPKLSDGFSLSEKSADGTVWKMDAFRVGGEPASDPFPGFRAAHVFWDVSASHAPTEAEFETLERLLAKEPLSEPGERAKGFCLHLFRNVAEPVQCFGTAAELVAAVRAVKEYDGGTSFAGLFDGITAAVPCLVFSDGIDTLTDEVDAIRRPPRNRTYVFTAASTADYGFLRRLGILVKIHPGPDAASRAVSDMRLAESVAGVVFDRESDLFDSVGFDLGDYRVEIGRTKSADGASETDRPVLPSAWAAAKIEGLAGNADALLALGREYGVVTPVTSLLVLESIYQYVEYDIEPPASQPELRKQWKEMREGVMGRLTPEALAERHLDALRDAWTERTNWWARDFRKNPYKEAQSAGWRGGPVPRAVGNGAAPAQARAMPADGAWACAALEPDADYCLEEAECAAAPAAKPRSAEPPAPASAASITVKPWQPDTEYLSALEKAEDPRAEYLARRAEWATSPSFFLDCATFFFRKGDDAFGRRVVSNLAELRLEDAALLRVMGWRLKEAKVYDLALDTFRRVLRLRPEDGQSERDLALVLDEAGRAAFSAGDAQTAKALLEEAEIHYRALALKPWDRHPMALSVFAVEEYNALRAWAAAQSWPENGAPKLPLLDERLDGNTDCDLRVIFSWDADETDVDLHVTEPSGEEAFYGHQRTYKGGFVSEDIVDGYGPEEYFIRVAEKGTYKIRAHFYASHAQTVFGPATLTATLYTDWGRANQAFSTLSARLEKSKEMLELGTFETGKK